MNLISIIILAVLIIAVIAAVVKIALDRSRGTSSCGGNCANCPMSGSCNKK